MSAVRNPVFWHISRIAHESYYSEFCRNTAVVKKVIVYIFPAFTPFKKLAS